MHPEIADVLEGRRRWCVITGDALAVLPTLPAGCVDCVLTDPPYYGVAREPWDHQWDTRDEYLSWLGRAADQWRCVLKPNGSLYVFASPRMAARVEGLIAERFNVLNNITWQKDFPCGALKYGPENFRGFVEMSERVIFAEQYGSDDVASADAGYVSKCEEVKRSVFGAYLCDEFKRAGVANREIAALFPSATGGLTGCVSNWLLGYNMPTAEQYAAMREFLDRRSGEYLRREYEDLRREYEDLRRPFFASLERPCTDVWTFKPVAQAALLHPCEKPLPLLEHVLESSTRDGDVVLDSFAGSGSVGLACVRLGRRCVLIERDQNYATLARRRLTQAEHAVQSEAAFFNGGSVQPTMFEL